MDINKRSNFLRAVSLTMFVFGLLIWGYVVIIQVTHPEWMGLTLTHLKIPPLNWRVDNIGVTGFVVAALGFFIWRLENGERKQRIQ